MNIPEIMKPNRTQALGLVFLVIAAFSAVGGWAWVMAYWDYSPVETYRGFEIVYFSTINVYGIDTGGEPQTWAFNSGLQGARNMIDNWLDNPELIEQYRDWIIYKMGGYGLYYAENGDLTTSNWDNITDLRSYIDAEYYPTLVYTIHRDSGDYRVYRQGVTQIRYWVDLDGTELEYFETLAAAKQYVYDLVQPADPQSTETPGDAEIPDIDADLDPDPEDYGTLGDLLDAQKWVITAISGTMGLGLVTFGSTRRDD